MRDGIGRDVTALQPVLRVNLLQGSTLLTCTDLRPLICNRINSISLRFADHWP